MYEYIKSMIFTIGVVKSSLNVKRETRNEQPLLHN